jgi:hypothetical protein
MATAWLLLAVAIVSVASLMELARRHAVGARFERLQRGVRR